MLVCMVLIDKFVGGVIGLFLFLMVLRVGQALKKSLRERKENRELRAKHLANCEVCRNHRDQFVGTS